MPELPEVEALAHHLRAHAVGRVVTRVDVASLEVLKTVTPPVTALHDRTVPDAGRRGKFLTLHTDGPSLVTHLARAGWLRWSDSLAPAPPKPGKGPIGLRVHLGGGVGFDLTEAGTQKRLAVYVVDDVEAVPGIARLGPDALALSRSDEILHAARLSPYATSGRLSEQALDQLHDALQQVLRAAMARCVGQDVARLKGEKRAGLAVHARTGLPCPICGDTRSRGQLRRPCVPVLPDLPDGRQAAGRPTAVPAAALSHPSRSPACRRGLNAGSAQRRAALNFKPGGRRPGGSPRW